MALTIDGVTIHAVTLDGAKMTNFVLDSVTTLAPPKITTQPKAVTVDVGKAAAFSVAATSLGGDLSYQWYLNGKAAAGQTKATYSWTPATANGGHAYDVYCKVSNANGSVNSATVKVTVKLGVFQEVVTVGIPAKEPSPFFKAADAAGYLAVQDSSYKPVGAHKSGAIDSKGHTISALYFTVDGSMILQVSGKTPFVSKTGAEQKSSANAGAYTLQFIGASTQTIKFRYVNGGKYKEGLNEKAKGQTIYNLLKSWAGKTITIKITEAN